MSQSNVDGDKTPSGNQSADAQPLPTTDTGENGSYYAEFLNIISGSDSAVDDVGEGADGAKKLMDESLSENAVDDDLLEGADKPSADNAVEVAEKEEHAAEVVTVRNHDNPTHHESLRSITGVDQDQPGRMDVNSEEELNEGEDTNETDETAPTNNNDVIKERRAPDGTDIGVEQVDEQAPQLNRRFYLGLDRASVRERRDRARQERAQRRRGRQTADSDDAESQTRQRRASGADPRMMTRMMSRIVHRASVTSSAPEVTIEATLVEDSEVVVAEQMSSFEQNWKKISIIMCFLLTLMAVLPVAVFLGDDIIDGLTSAVSTATAVPTKAIPPSFPTALPTSFPSLQPSSPPSFSNSPTLEMVQGRGEVRCGLLNSTIISASGLKYDLCRAVAAVLFGNPEKIKPVPASIENRFQLLNDRNVDLLLTGDTHTLKREVVEPSTGAGFSFSSPYYYDGMVYFGDKTLVRCAENQKRYGECDNLKICISNSSHHLDFVESSFPSDFVTAVPPLEIEGMMMNDTCNVTATDRSYLQKSAFRNGNNSNYALGKKMVDKNPLAIVTRNNDREFSDVVNWVVQALFYGEEQGVAKNLSLCQNYTNLTGNISDLVFLNAVYCVGSYIQIFDEGLDHRGMNSINDGSTGMIYAIPFGELETDDDDFVGIEVNTSRLDNIRDTRTLNCGVLVPGDFDGNITESSKLVGMSVDYCRTLAAALFNGDGEFGRLKFTPFSGNVSTAFGELGNRTLDVLAGANIQRKYDFESSSSFDGFHFSTPYYFGNETAGEDASFISLATWEDEHDALFSSFVNAVVSATIYAQENNIKKKQSKEMPVVSFFGSELKWALRDAISFLGNYDQIYTKNFDNFQEKDRGRNILNENGGPQIHSFPGLTHGQ